MAVQLTNIAQILAKKTTPVSYSLLTGSEYIAVYKSSKTGYGFIMVEESTINYRSGKANELTRRAYIRGNVNTLAKICRMAEGLTLRGKVQVIEVPLSAIYNDKHEHYDAILQINGLTRESAKELNREELSKLYEPKFRKITIKDSGETVYVYTEDGENIITLEMYTPDESAEDVLITNIRYDLPAAVVKKAASNRAAYAKSRLGVEAKPEAKKRVYKKRAATKKS